MAKKVTPSTSTIGNREIADNMFDMLVSGDKENCEIVRLQREAYPREYEAAKERIANTNREICAQVKQLVADTVFGKNHLKDRFHWDIFVKYTTMFQIEIASHEANKNLPLLLFYCVPSCPLSSLKNQTNYTGGKYEAQQFYCINDIPAWVVKKYNVFSEKMSGQERIETRRVLQKFKENLTAIMSKASERCPQYALLRDIANRLAK